MLKKSGFLLLLSGLVMASAGAQRKNVSPVRSQSVSKEMAASDMLLNSRMAHAVTPNNDTGFVMGPDSLEYKWVIHGTGLQTAAVSDFGEMSVIFRIGDTVIINTDEMNDHRPVTQPITAPSMEGDLMSGIVKMKAGDSVVFRMISGTFFERAKQPKPSWVKPTDYISWQVKMVRVLTKLQMDTETANKEKAQKAIDDSLLQDYFKSHHIKNVKKTTSGIYYTVTKAGAGLHPKMGQKVKVNYTGENRKGEKFDSNTDPAFNHPEPFEFVLGKKNVISGWDEAVALMNKGMKARFYLPSGTAYGEHGQGPKIGPNEILIFDIELLSFK